MKAPAAKVARKIIVFCKQPIPGHTKTRLATRIGAEEAARVSDELTRRCIRQCVNVGSASVEVWQTPEVDDAFLLPGVAGVHGQCTGDLGRRMQDALERSLEDCSTVILIGTDCPGMTADYLQLAFDRLRHHDIVIGPAEDGGFGLIGMTRAPGDLFSDMTWSTSGVYEEMKRRLDGKPVSWCRLPLLWDVDRPSDLYRYRSIYS